MVVLTAEVEEELALALERPVDRAEVDFEGGDSLVFEGETFALVRRGVLQVLTTGDMPPGKKVGYQVFEDTEAERTIRFERWGSTTEVRTGERIEEGEITILRREEESYDLRAPQRLDLRAVNQARQESQKRRSGPSEEQRAKSLAEARAKLAAINESSNPPPSD